MGSTQGGGESVPITVRHLRPVPNRVPGRAAIVPLTPSTRAIFLGAMAFISATAINLVDGSRGSSNVVFPGNEKPAARLRVVSRKVRTLHEVCPQESN